MLYYHVSHWVEYAPGDAERKAGNREMANRVTVGICGEEYTFVADESATYMQKVAAYVDEKLDALQSEAKAGRTAAAVLTAVNIADELFKERESSDALRRQIKEYIDEAAKAKSEISELKREIFKLQSKK